MIKLEWETLEDAQEFNSVEKLGSRSREYPHDRVVIDEISVTFVKISPLKYTVERQNINRGAT